MSDELKAAKERLRIHNQEGSRGEPYSDWHYQDGCQDSETRLKDLELLADAYLAGNHADDDEPVTYEWAECTNAIYHPALRQYAWKAGGPITVRLLWWPDCKNGEWNLEIGSEMSVIDLNGTRGDVRRLCKALGIELKESG